MQLKTTSESTNVLQTFMRQWKLLKQPYPWKDPKVLAERKRIAALDRARIELRLNGGVE
jgi:hypothetical protein